MKRFFFLIITAIASAAVAFPASAITVPKPVEGGANQVNAVSGCANKWLFNGVWRFRVTGLTSDVYYGHKEWMLDVELRNATSKTHELQDTGVYYTGKGTQVVDKDDNSSDVNGDDFYYHFSEKALIQGQGLKHKLIFRDLGDGVPAKLILPIDPSSNHDAVHYAVKDPSFRVDLTCGGLTPA